MMNSMEQTGAASGNRPAQSPFKARKTLIFANDKSSGKTTTANAKDDNDDDNDGDDEADEDN